MRLRPPVGITTGGRGSDGFLDELTDDFAFYGYWPAFGSPTRPKRNHAAMGIATPLTDSVPSYPPPPERGSTGSQVTGRSPSSRSVPLPPQRWRVSASTSYPLRHSSGLNYTDTTMTPRPLAPFGDIGFGRKRQSCRQPGPPRLT